MRAVTNVTVVTDVTVVMGFAWGFTSPDSHDSHDSHGVTINNVQIAA